MVLQLLILLLLVLLNGLFAMSELALVGARRTRLEAAAGRRSWRGEGGPLLLEDPGRFLSTVSIGITLVGVLVSTIGGDSFVAPLTELLEPLAGFGAYAHPLALGIVVVAVSASMIVLGELVPKRIALGHPEALAMALARFMTVFARIARPLEILLSGVSSMVLLILPIRSTPQQPVTDEDQSDDAGGAATGAFHPGESAIVQMALRLGDRRVEAIMTPRTQVEFLDLEDDWQANRQKLLHSTYSRFPVVEGGADKLVGVLQVKDLLGQTLGGEPADLRKALRKPLFVPNTVPVLALLETLKQSGETLALVVDEYGEFEGLVTLDDFFQALVGDIAEPGVEEDQLMVRREDGSWLIDGLTPIESVKDTLPIARLPNDDEGEFHVGRLHDGPTKAYSRVADRVDVDGWRFEVVDMDGHRVDKVLAAVLGER